MKAPVAMPDMYVSQQQFELQRVDFVSPEASGRLNGVQAGFPLWSGVWTLARMPVENSDEWRAFLTATRGQTRRFIGRDIARSYPRAYPDGFAGMTRAGGGSFDGTSSSARNRDQSRVDGAACRCTEPIPAPLNTDRR